MTVLNAGRPTRGSTAIGILLGGVIGFFVATLLVSAIGYVIVKKQGADARRGWNLVPVTVASQDIAEKTAVTFRWSPSRSVARSNRRAARPGEDGEVVRTARGAPTPGAFHVRGG